MSLYTFNPRNTGLYEARLWKAYYDRQWPRALALLFRLMRSQFGLSLVDAARATLWGIRASIIFAPPEHDDKAVLKALERFYTVVRNGSDGRFDPHAAAAAELDYWIVHRRLAGQKGSAALKESLARLSACVYGLSPDQTHPSAALRAHACDLVDDITGGRQAPTHAAWSAIEDTLRRSYALLRLELESTP
ncbi:MAG TPA: hypothetical protein VFE42_10270 [Chloroflexota bacterium]|nr:hypothetical protein [Chloroflexota bacterium]